VVEEEEQFVSEHYVPLPHGGALSSCPSTGSLQSNVASPETRTRRWIHPHRTPPLNWTTTTPSGNQPGDRQAQKCVWRRLDLNKTWMVQAQREKKE